MKKAPSSPAGPQENSCAPCSAHAKSLGTPAHGGLDEPAAKHGHAMKNAHSDHPGVAKCEGAGCAMRIVRTRGLWPHINRQDGRRLWPNSQLRYDFLGAVRLSAVGWVELLRNPSFTACSPDGAKRNPGPVVRVATSRIALRSIRATGATSPRRPPPPPSSCCPRRSDDGRRDRRCPVAAKPTCRFPRRRRPGCPAPSTGSSWRRYSPSP